MCDRENEAAIWQVDFTKKAEKQAKNLPPEIYATLALLKGELEIEGPIQSEWQNYGKLKGKKNEYHHCHLNCGHPRYVAVWKIIDNTICIMEIVFAGPHGSVHYNEFK